MVNYAFVEENSVPSASAASLWLPSKAAATVFPSPLQIEPAALGFDLVLQINFSKV